jgi:hypothetical protein
MIMCRTELHDQVAAPTVTEDPLHLLCGGSCYDECDHWPVGASDPVTTSGGGGALTSPAVGCSPRHPRREASSEG